MQNGKHSTLFEIGCRSFEKASNFGWLMCSAAHTRSGRICRDAAGLHELEKHHVDVNALVIPKMMFQLGNAQVYVSGTAIAGTVRQEESQKVRWACICLRTIVDIAAWYSLYSSTELYLSLVCIKFPTSTWSTYINRQKRPVRRVLGLATYCSI